MLFNNPVKILSIFEYYNNIFKQLSIMLRLFHCLLLFICLQQEVSAQKILNNKQKKIYETPEISGSNINILHGKQCIVYIKDPNLAYKSANYTIIKRLSYFQFVVNILNDTEASKELIEITKINSLWKASENLVQKFNENNKKRIEVQLIFKNDINITDLLGYGKVTLINSNTARLKLDLEQLKLLLNNDKIIFAGAVYKPVVETPLTTQISSTSGISYLRSNDNNLTGKNIVASIKEDKFDDKDLDLKGRIIATEKQSSKISSHATTMATSIGGNGNTFISGIGVAPEIQLTSSNFTELFPDVNLHFTDNHIVIQNHSYGTEIENYYSPEAALYDKQISDLDTLVHIFSAGNIGNAFPITGIYAGIPNFSNLSGGFKQAKNILVIGGVNKFNDVEALSSKGPAFDGRVKPELVAFGEDGTSGAAALTTGVVALMQQSYINQNKKAPSSALIKAILINSAQQIDSNPVSYSHGYGLIDASTAVQNIQQHQFLQTMVNDNEQADYFIHVPDSISLLKVTAAWNDPATTLNAGFALVNDVDIVVETPLGVKYLPWVLNHYPNKDSLLQAPKRKRDSLNNVEQVTIDNPMQGTFKIRIKGTNIKNKPQPVYIAFSYDKKEHFNWSYPSLNAKIIAREPTIIRWNSTYKNKKGSIQISYDNGITWSILQTVDVDKNYFEWTPPLAFTQAIIKISIGNKEYASSPFSISVPLVVSVSYYCKDEVQLKWNRQQSSIGYNVYNIKGNKLQLLKSTKDTLITLPINEVASNYFAVSAFGNSFEGTKSYTIDIAKQGVNCFIQLLSASKIDKQIRLSLQLSSTDKIKTISWEKQISYDKFQFLAKTSVQTNTKNYIHFDNQLKQGIQYYRVTLETVNGKNIVSDLIYVISFQDEGFALYPNPFTDKINIVTNSYSNYELKLFDMFGKLKFQATIYGNKEQIPISNLPSGVYVATISIQGKNVFDTKLIKL
jgi:hypothetical protein